MSSPSQFTRPTWLLIVALVAAMWFATLNVRKLVKPDEGRYAEIGREMALSGDWVTPRLNGIKYFEKPPLQYWATAAAYRVFGEHEWTARLWSATTGFAGLLIAAWAGRRLFGTASGQFGALALAGSLWYVAIGHINTLDMGVSCFLELAICAFLVAQAEEDVRRRRRTMLVAWAGMGLAIMSKGLIGLVLPGATLFLYSLIRLDLGVWRRLHLIPGCALLLAICAPWFIAVSLANPEFPRFFFIHEHFERFLTKTHRRVQPWYYFAPLVIIGSMPWLAATARGFWEAWRQPPAGTVNARLFLALWCVVVFLFFSASQSKLPSYILPLFPALALLAGDHLSRSNSATLRWHMMLSFVLGIAFLVFVTFSDRFALHSAELPKALIDRYVRWLEAAALAAIIGSAIAWQLTRRSQNGPAILSLALTGLVTTQIALNGHDSLRSALSTYDLAQELRPKISADAPFYSVLTYDQTLPFYLKRKFTLVAYQDEFAFGLQQEPSLHIPQLDQFDQVWRKQALAYALMTPDSFERLTHLGLPMRVIARDARRIVVATP